VLDGFDDQSDDEGVFKMEEEEDVEEDALEGWSWAGTAQIRRESCESFSTRASTPPHGFVGSPVLHACLKELRELRERIPSA
jgi:hypothetical protein